MAFKREIEEHLSMWKKSEARKPLILRGARQVGKTTLIQEFARNYTQRIMLNLEKATDRKFFEDFDDIKNISEALFLSFNISSDKINETVLFIDEIQESPKAIQMLRYFYEELPALHVIAAGSLLEFSIQKIKSFPVGRVTFLYLHPMNFSEYLNATGHQIVLDELEKIPVKPSANKVLNDLFHRYAIIGGMPEVVKTDIQQNNLADLPEVYESIWATYQNDVEKYTSNDTERKVIKHIMVTAPFYIDQRIKFQGFGNSNYRSREVGEALRTLDDAKIMRIIYPTTDIQTPLKPDLKKSPRIQVLDTGIVNHVLGIQAQMLGMDDLNVAYKGAVIPHLIIQELISLNTISDQKPYFWVRDKKQSDAEVDLVYAYKGKAIPIEIKSGSTGSLKSLHQFLESSDYPYAIRIYGGQFKIENAITPNRKPYLLLNLPYYLGTKIPRYVEWFIENHKIKV